MIKLHCFQGPGILFQQFQTCFNKSQYLLSVNFWIVHVLGLSIRPSMSQSIQFVQNRQISINFWTVHVLGLSIRPSMSSSIQFGQNRQILIFIYLLILVKILGARGSSGTISSGENHKYLMEGPNIPTTFNYEFVQS